MPWTGKSFASKNKSLNKPEAKQAASVANAVLKKSGDEGKAIRIANWQAKRLRKRGAISDKAASKYGLDGEYGDVDAATR